MSREVRRVPEDWNHPKVGKRYIPLQDGYWNVLSDWNSHFHTWQSETKSYSQEEFEEWFGEKPIRADYMPDFPEDKRTHYQMYETCSEGTPISPVMATPEDLARWLTDNKADAGCGRTATYEEWLFTINSPSHWAPTFYLPKEGPLISGVEAKFKEGT
jgi:hypothetical protein